MTFVPATPRIIGDNTVIFGTGGLFATGIVLSASVMLDGDILELKDNTGFVYCVVYFNDKNECEIQIILKTDTAEPVRGDNITIGGVADCLVKNAKKEWEDAGEAKYTLQATRYVNVDTSIDSAGS